MTRWLSAVLLVLGPAAAGGELRGRVLVDNKPVAGATVCAIALEAPLEEARRSALRQDEPRPIATTTTKPDGTFALVVPATAGAFRLRSSGGGTTGLVHPRVFDAADGEDAFDLVAAKAVALAGRVVDGLGGPVVAATVTLRSAAIGPFSAAEATPVTATTGADGSFKFPQAAETGNELRVEAPGFATLDRTGLRGGALHRPLALSPGRAIAGTVLLPDRRTPAAGALVRYEGRSNTRWAEVRKDGTFLVDGVPGEPGVLVADAGERGRASASVPEAGRKASLVLAPTAGVRGRVVDASSIAPLAGIRVVARCDGTWSTRSGADGRYEIRGLPPGVCRLTADDARFVPWERRHLTIAAGEAEAQDVPLVRAATLSGRVVDVEGRPVEGAMGRLLRAGSSFDATMRVRFGPPAFRSGRDGSFKATRLAPGSNVQLTVMHDEFEPRTVGGLTLPGGAAKSGLVVVLARGLTVRGLVKDENGLPVAGAELDLVRAMNFQSGRGGGMATMTVVGGSGAQNHKTTGPDGRFEFHGLAPGDYTLMARKTGLARERIDPLKVAEGPEGEPLQVVLRTGAVITGFVRDKAGNGAAGWRIAARPARGGSGGMIGGPVNDEPSGPDGAFLLDGLTPGESYDLQLFGPRALGPRKTGVVAPAEVELQVSGLGQIRGTVVDADTGRPLPDFEVGYEQAGPMGGMRFVFRGPGGNRQPGEPISVHADDGAFVLEDVPAGAWDVKVAAHGYQKGRFAGVTVLEGGTAEGVDVRLSRGGVISGRVTEERTGRPVLDATVRAEPVALGSMRFGLQDQGSAPTTDAEGRFTIEGLAPGSYTLTATHPEWTELMERVELKDQPAVAELRFRRGGSVTGTVLAGGRGVSAAGVALAAAGETRYDPFGSSGSQSTVSDESGRFRFDRLPPGRYTLSASLRGQSSPAVETVLQGSESNPDVSLVLTQGALIRGTVRGLSDESRGNVRVTASGAEDYVAGTRTAADGSFELAGAPPGLVSLQASLGDFMGQGSRTARGSVTVGEGQAEATAEIVFQTGFRIDGRVTRGGQPVTDAMVSAFPQAGTGSGSGPGFRSSSTSRTDETGTFTLEDLPEATYTLIASSMSRGGPIRKTVKVTGDLTVDLEAPPARLGGRVVEAETGRALGEAMVRAEEVQRTSGPGGMMVATSDSSGRFSLEDLEPKAFHLSVSKPAFQTETRDVTPAEDSDLTIELRRGEGVELVARDGIFGVPLRGVFARVSDAQGASVFMGEVSLDSEGRGEIPSLKAGSYQLRVGGEGYAPVSLPAITVPSPALTVSLTPGGKVEIQVGPETLARPGGAIARLLGPGGAPFNPHLFSTDGLLRFGNPIYRLPNVAPGRYTLAVDGGAQRDLEVREGGSVTVSLP